MRALQQAEWSLSPADSMLVSRAFRAACDAAEAYSMRVQQPKQSLEAGGHQHLRCVLAAWRQYLALHAFLCSEGVQALPPHLASTPRETLDLSLDAFIALAPMLSQWGSARANTTNEPRAQRTSTARSPASRARLAHSH